MDLKKKVRKFFTLTRQSNAGFTLVELVIVIAILAILAGVAVPAYNGYIAKAKEASDQMIVAAANDAFAAACMENKVDAIYVTEASVSVLDGKIYGLSSATYDSDTAFVEKIAPYFLTYLAENGENTFKTPNINSLIWNDGLDTFEMSESFVSTRIVLSSGKNITVSAEDMEKIANSTYSDMGYSGVKAVIEDVGKSGETLASICGVGTGISTDGNLFLGTLKVTGYTGLLPKLTDAMKAYGLIDDAKATEINSNICGFDDLITGGHKASEEEKNQSIQEAANGLTMITAKYLASGGNPEELLAIDLGDSSTGVIQPMATGTGGTKTVSAIALQYALASSFANSDAASGATIDGKTVSEYLASSEDPVKAIDAVKNLDAYKNNYVSSDPDSQYQKDINGFVGTMSVLGNNMGTITAPGNIDLNDFLANGINSSDAEDVLSAVLGE